MPTLPERPNLEHLRAQAKDLLRQCRAADPGAMSRLAQTLPPLRRPPQLHDAQSCLSREYGFVSWTELVRHVETRALAAADSSGRLLAFLHLAYDGDLNGSYDRARPELAASLLAAAPDLLAHDAVALAVGAPRAFGGALDRPVGPLALPPLVAVTHSALFRLPERRDDLRAAAAGLLAAGADPNARVANRYPPASLAAPDASTPLSALYGAAGVQRDPALTRTLLEAGADPNDGESLYHSLESVECARLLLAHGARVAGSNALRRALDMASEDALLLLLDGGADPNEAEPEGPTRFWGPPLLRALAVRRPISFIAALLAAGADPNGRTPAGLSAYSLARQTGHDEAAAAIAAAGGDTALDGAAAFVAACAAGDEAAARRLQGADAALPRALPPEQRRLLPDAVAWGAAPAAIRLMVALGWPLDARGGDWDASALNHAVFRGDAALTAFLLAAGADWRDRQGYGDDVLGTLSYASIYPPYAAGDWAGCARALRPYLPGPAEPTDDPERVRVAGRNVRMAAEAAEALIGASATG